MRVGVRIGGGVGLRVDVRGVRGLWGMGWW